MMKDISIDKMADLASGIMGIPGFARAPDAPSSCSQSSPTKGDAEGMRRLIQMTEQMMGVTPKASKKRLNETSSGIKRNRATGNVAVNRILDAISRIAGLGDLNSLRISEGLSGEDAKRRAGNRRRLSRLSEREEATGTNWVKQLGDVYDSIHSLSKDIHEAYLVEKKSIRGKGKPNEGDPVEWLNEFKQRLEGVIAEMKGVIRTYKKSTGAEEPEESEESEESMEEVPETPE